MRLEEHQQTVAFEARFCLFGWYFFYRLDSTGAFFFFFSSVQAPAGLTDRSTSDFIDYIDSLLVSAWARRGFFCRPKLSKGLRL